MKIKILCGKHRGSICEARLLSNGPLKLYPSYQVISGNLMGEIFNYTECIEISEKQKTFTEAEFNAMVKFYEEKINDLKYDLKNWKDEANDLDKQNEKLLNELENLRQEKLTQTVDTKIKNWLERGYESSEEEDRIEFAKELTAFIKQELTSSKE